MSDLPNKIPIVRSFESVCVCVWVGDTLVDTYLNPPCREEKHGLRRIYYF